MFVVYEFADEVRAFVGQRQIAGTYMGVSDHLMGSAGYAEIPLGREPFIKGKETWRYQGPKPDMYQAEHDELFASIRRAKPLNDGQWMAHSTLMGIMGRMAAYTGQEVSWEQALNSEEKLVPDELDWKMRLDITPLAMPGSTKLA
jgi:myo-inositol 2-dehydrogenase/D-chiro-inositol 1-dehydrogenase